jgi:hypothetical protein
MAALETPNLTARQTQSDAGQFVTGTKFERGDVGLRETVRGFLQASEADYKMLKNGGIIRACESSEKEMGDQFIQAKQRSEMLSDIVTAINGGANVNLTKDFITAAYDGYADPNGALGVLNNAITLIQSFGHLENILLPFKDIITDTSGVPVLHKQWARSRYQRVPGVMIKTALNSWETNYTSGYDQDVSVQMANFAGVSIGVNNFVQGTSIRSLIGEQKNPLLYALAQYMFYTVINGAINGTLRFANDGTTQTTITAASQFVDPTFGKGAFNVAGANLATFTSALRAAMNKSQMPGGDEPAGVEDLMRYVWANTDLEATISADVVFQQLQSIQGIAQNKGENLIQTGMFTRIGNNKFRASQLICDNNSLDNGTASGITTGGAGTGADSGTNAMFVVPGNSSTSKVVGIGGTRNGLMFVSRPPLDYTKGDSGIPQTAAVEMFVTPKLGIPFMIVKYLHHGYETQFMRAESQWGVGIGDERQLMLLRQQ